MDEREREQHRSALVRGSLREVEAAVIALLEVDDPVAIDPADVIAVLDAAERPDVRRSAATFELILHLVAGGAPATLQPVGERLERTPLSESGYVCAAILGEVAQRPDARGLLHRGRLSRALAAAVVQGVQAGQEALTTVAVNALFSWSRLEPVPEASAPMVELLERAIDEADPDEDRLRAAVGVLTANGQLDLISSFAGRVRALSPDHPLRRLLEGLSGA